MLKNKIDVITGAGAGIGEATARIFDRENIEGIAIVDYNYEAACKVAESLGDKAIAVKCDISNWDDVQAAYEKVIERFGRVDILVNNAGITRDGMFHKMSIDQWNAVVNTNLNGTFHWTRVVINAMREQGYGRIVNLSSGSVRGIVGQTNYSATKAALQGFTNSLAKEVAAKGITVNCVAPGATKTAMYDAVPEKVYQAAIEANPMKRLGEPSEIGEVIAFISSERASYLNGQWVLVNGGK